jgi:hypothetical protein
MNQHLTNNFLWVGFYLALIVWAILVVVLLTGLVKKKWLLVKRSLKYLINSIVFLIAWMFILELALVVRTPFLSTKQASIKELENWISRNQIENVYVALGTVLVLFGVNLLFYFKVEHKQNKRDLLILAISAIIVLAFGIELAGQNAYYGLLEEINRHFG